MFKLCLFKLYICTYSSTLYIVQPRKVAAVFLQLLFFRNLCKSGTTCFRFRFCRLSGGWSTHLQLFGALFDHLAEKRMPSLFESFGSATFMFL